MEEWLGILEFGGTEKENLGINGKGGGGGSRRGKLLWTGTAAAAAAQLHVLGLVQAEVEAVASTQQ